MQANSLVLSQREKLIAVLILAKRDHVKQETDHLYTMLVTLSNFR